MRRPAVDSCLWFLRPLSSGRRSSNSVDCCPTAVRAVAHCLPRCTSSQGLLLTAPLSCPPLLCPADDLFLDDVPEAQQGGFLSLLTGGAKPVVATAIASAV